MCIYYDLSHLTHARAFKIFNIKLRYCLEIETRELLLLNYNAHCFVKVELDAECCELSHVDVEV